MGAAGLTARGPLAAAFCFKGDSSSSGTTIDRRIGASDEARVFNVSDDGKIKFGKQKGKKGKGNNQQGIIYAERGGTAIQAKKYIVNDGSTQTAALDNIAELTGATLSKLTALAETKAQDASVQNKQLAYAAIIGLMAVGGIYFYTRKN